MLFSLFELIRIKDWIKNFILFLPLIFSNNLQNFYKYNDLILAFIIFCFAASFIYIINDIKDIDNDKLHPIKKNKKPLAANKFNIFFARSLSFVFLLMILFLLFFNKVYIYHVVAYISLNIFYTYVAKKIIIIDLLILSFGYIIRVDVGSVAIGVQTSTLMILTIFSLSLFVISLKRVGEININSLSKNNIYFNNSTLLNFFVLISGISSVFFYFLYVLYIKNSLLISCPFVLFLLFRYYRITINTNQGEFPIDLFFKDKLLLIFSTIYFAYAIYVYL